MCVEMCVCLRPSLTPRSEVVASLIAEYKAAERADYPQWAEEPHVPAAAATPAAAAKPERK